METGRGTLLLVGDGPMADAVAERLQERLPVGVEAVTALDTAREHVTDESVVAVVSDFDVPDADGIEHLRGLDLLEYVRSQEGDLPVVLVSTSGNEDVVAEAMARDVTDYVLLEGFDDRAIDRLVQRVEYAVEKRLAELRAEEQAHVVDVIRDVTDGLVRAATRETVASTLAERLTDARPYVGACVADDGGVVASAGEPVTTDAVDALVADSPGSPTVWSRDSSTDHVSLTVESRPVDSLPEALTAAGGRSVVTVPITYAGADYGSLVVLSDRSATDETQLSVLAQLAETAGYAVDTVETRAELERQNERLDGFASLVSHDLRNPLNVVRGRIDLLAAETDTDHVDPIRRSVDRMEQIIDDMLALAREGQVATDLELLSLSTTAEDVWADFDPDEATLVVTGDRELQADYGALCEIFENLYRNALEHAGDDVTVTAGPLDDGFFVADDGPGIPADERAQVFEYGYTTDRDGTGYGLPIVERIADAHGWSVQVAESADAGARFEITGVE